MLTLGSTSLGWPFRGPFGGPKGLYKKSCFHGRVTLFARLFISVCVSGRRSNWHAFFSPSLQAAANMTAGSTSSLLRAAAPKICRPELYRRLKIGIA